HRVSAIPLLIPRLLHLPFPPLFPYTTLFRSFTSSLLGRTLRRVICLVLAKPASTSVESLLRKISLKPNSPSAKATNEIPSWRVLDRKSTRLNSSHVSSSYAVFCLKKKRLLPN